MAHGQNRREITRVVAPGMIKTLHCKSPSLSIGRTFLFGRLNKIPQEAAGAKTETTTEFLKALLHGRRAILLATWMILSERFCSSLVCLRGVNPKETPKILAVFWKGTNTQPWHSRCVARTAVWKSCYEAWYSETKLPKPALHFSEPPDFERPACGRRDREVTCF